jgi:hypothetical protein
MQESIRTTESVYSQDKACCNGIHHLKADSTMIRGPLPIGCCARGTTLKANICRPIVFRAKDQVMTWSFCYQLPNVGNSLKICDHDNGLLGSPYPGYGVAVPENIISFPERLYSKIVYAELLPTQFSPSNLSLELSIHD